VFVERFLRALGRSSKVLLLDAATPAMSCRPAPRSTAPMRHAPSTRWRAAPDYVLFLADDD
jgi:hypothetical protein